MSATTSSVRAAGLVMLGVLFAVMICWRNELRLFVVSGKSMQPTLREGDLLLLDKTAYREATPERGDLVIARHAGEWVVKRVVGLPGEFVEVKAGTLLVNGLPVMPDFDAVRGELTLRRGWVFRDHYALLGDNRALSGMETMHGVIPREDILGRVVLIVRLFPWRVETPA